MLIISRKKNEGIIINGDIILTVADVYGDKVRIGIEAPESVKIKQHRAMRLYMSVSGNGSIKCTFGTPDNIAFTGSRTAGLK